METAKKKGLLRIIVDHIIIRLCYVYTYIQYIHTVRYKYVESELQNSSINGRHKPQVEPQRFRKSHQTYGKSITDQGDFHMGVSKNNGTPKWMVYNL